MPLSTTFQLYQISWQSVLLVEETGENHRPASSHRQTLSHNVVSSTTRHEQDSNYVRLSTFVLGKFIVLDCKLLKFWTASNLYLYIINRDVQLSNTKIGIRLLGKLFL